MKNLKYPFIVVLFGALLTGCVIKCYELPSACELTPDPGPCEALIERYFYNQETGECEMFHWGGCEGVVPFETLEECEACADDRSL